MGELLAEIMRAEAGVSLGRRGGFVGPFPSGAPGIFIDTAARLGHSAAIVSGVGDDAFGEMILERLGRDGVELGLVEVAPGRSTGTAFIGYEPDGSREYLFHWDDTPAVMAQVPSDGAAEGARFFHVMGCSLMANMEFAARIVDTARLFHAAGARITFDPNIRVELLAGRDLDDIMRPLLGLTSVLLPSEPELLALGGTGDIDDAAAKLLEMHGLEAVVVKRGAAGSTVYAADTRTDIGAFPAEEIDPTGAGDCFDAGFVCGLLDGDSLEDAARQGAAVGALSVGGFGPMEGDISPRSVARLLAAR